MTPPVGPLGVVRMSVHSSEALSCCSQQDAQEFLRFLLDGLHNEVNRVTVRPRGHAEDLDHLP